MRYFAFVIILLSVFNPAFSKDPSSALIDTLEIIKLNQAGYEHRLIDPNQTLAYGKKALQLSKKANYLNGIAEAYRIIGIGSSYHNQNEIAIESYLNSLSYFQKNGNKEGEAKVYNNIGNLYISVDFDKSLEYFQKSLKIARELQIKGLIAGLNLNIGTVYQKKHLFNQALKSYQESFANFSEIGNSTGVTQCLQNIGVAYFKLNLIKDSENYLKQAINKAKENDLNFVVAGSNLTLSSVYIAKGDFQAAQKSIDEGIAYSRIIQDSRLEYDFTFTLFELENRKKNYKGALGYLKQIYTQDSLTYKNNESTKLTLRDKQYRQQAKQLENERIILEQKYTKTLFWAISAVTALAFFAIFLLIRNNRKSNKTNKQLIRLNQEVLQQKEDLDRINQSLEEIIDERTRDLKIKNNKLSEYSSHLSHQIRGPVATIKGLLILETDNLIEHEELVEQLQVCIQDIDNKILNINETLNNSSKHSLHSE
ncbi:sensor histidine kinase [Flavihumibacter sp. R14]|nr:sensor histidine kinase [Flavihumibacter soli]